MRYHYEKPESYSTKYGKVYRCKHDLYNRCTLYERDGRGLAVIQAHFSPVTKHIWWGEIDPYLVDDIYEQERFENYFARNAEEPDEEGVYPTVTLRQIMWAMRMKPLQKEFWEAWG